MFFTVIFSGVPTNPPFEKVTAEESNHVKTPTKSCQQNRDAFHNFTLRGVGVGGVSRDRSGGAVGILAPCSRAMTDLHLICIRCKSAGRIPV